MMGRITVTARVLATLLVTGLGSLVLGAAVPPVEREAVELELENGLRILVRERPSSGQVALAVGYRAGAAYESPGQSGLAHLVEHLTFRGTPTLGSLDWSTEREVLAEMVRVQDALSLESRKAEAADFLALARHRRRLAELAERQASLSDPQPLLDAYRGCGAVQPPTASTGRDYVVYWVQIPPSGLGCALRLEAARMEHAIFRGFVEEVRTVLLELDQLQDQPQVERVEKILARVLPGHPYGRSNWGNRREIPWLTIRQAQGFYRRFYHPANAAVAIVGDVEADRVLADAAAAFAPLTAGQASPSLPPLPPIGPARIEGIETVAGVPSVVLAWQWPPRTAPEVPALYVLATVLEQRLRAELVEIPENRALGVDVQELAAGGAAGGLTLVHSEARGRAALAVIEEEMARQIRDLRHRRVLDTELRTARLRVLAKIEKIMEEPSELARALALIDLQSPDSPTLSELRAAVVAVDAETLHWAARHHLSPPYLATLILNAGGT